MSSEGNLFILSAPSGSGKTSLANGLLNSLENLRFSVSYTTRQKRKGESHGVEYFFISPPEFEKMIEEERFLEFAHVYGHYYGTARDFVEAQLSSGVDVLLDIDVQGALKVKNLMPNSVMVFVLPPSFQVLGDRLRKRGLDDEEVIRKRLDIARDEIRYYAEYDYVIINNSIDRSLLELKAVVLATRCRLRSRKSEARKILNTFLRDSFSEENSS